MLEGHTSVNKIFEEKKKSLLFHVSSGVSVNL